MPRASKMIPTRPRPSPMSSLLPSPPSSVLTLSPRFLPPVLLLPLRLLSPPLFSRFLSPQLLSRFLSPLLLRLSRFLFLPVSALPRLLRFRSSLLFRPARLPLLLERPSFPLALSSCLASQGLLSCLASLVPVALVMHLGHRLLSLRSHSLFLEPSPRMSMQRSVPKPEKLRFASSVLQISSSGSAVSRSLCSQTVKRMKSRNQS